MENWKMVVNLGFIGCGWAANNHVQKLTRIPEAKMVAFCDVNLQRAEKTAEPVGARAYSDYQQMLQREKLDAIYVGVPPFAHGFESEIAERGIHLFVEKPVALTVDIAKKIERAIAKAGVINSVGYMWRYLDTTAIAMEVLKENEPIGMMEGRWIGPFWTPPEHWWASKSKGGGQVLEQSTHVFDLARYLAGDVSRVYAELDTRIATDVPGFDVEDVSIVTLKFKNGAMGVILSSCTSRNTFTSTALTIIAKNVVVEHGGSGALKVYKDDEIREIRPKVDSYYEEDRVFIDAVANGNMSAIKSPYSDAIKTLEVTIAANVSSREHRIVSLK
jgi:predicted dehydrogenase